MEIFRIISPSPFLENVICEKLYTKRREKSNPGEGKPMEATRKKLLDRVRDAIRLKH